MEPPSGPIEKRGEWCPERPKEAEGHLTKFNPTQKAHRQAQGRQARLTLGLKIVEKPPPLPKNEPKGVRTSPAPDKISHDLVYLHPPVLQRLLLRGPYARSRNPAGKAPIGSRCRPHCQIQASEAGVHREIRHQNSSCPPGTPTQKMVPSQKRRTHKRGRGDPKTVSPLSRATR